MDSFKENLTKRFEESLKKSIINDELLKEILFKFDDYISNNINTEFRKLSDQKRFFNVMICRLYIKISLIMPLKTNAIINMEIFNVTDNRIRSIKHNNIEVKLPNSVKRDMISTIKYAEKTYKVKYNGEQKLFEFLFDVLGVKLVTASITEVFKKSYNLLKISELLEKKDSGFKKRFLYPPESYKTTAIYNMIKNGTDIIVLKQLTGLEFSALIKKYNLDDRIERADLKSDEINNGIIKNDYFSYL